LMIPHYQTNTPHVSIGSSCRLMLLVSPLNPVNILEHSRLNLCAYVTDMATKKCRPKISFNPVSFSRYDRIKMCSQKTSYCRANKGYEFFLAPLPGTRFLRKRNGLL
jgi:hypothetical protein